MNMPMMVALIPERIAHILYVFRLKLIFLAIAAGMAISAAVINPPTR